MRLRRKPVSPSAARRCRYLSADTAYVERAGEVVPLL